MKKYKLTLIVSALFCMVKLSQAANSTYPEFDIANNYDGNSIVSYKDKVYINAWYAAAGQCPAQKNCPEVYRAGLWNKYTSAKHEFDFYNYTNLQADYPKLPTCTASEFSISQVQNIINTNVEIKSAAPSGGYTQHDKNALYSEFMLPCKPNLNFGNISSLPSNVQTLMRVMPESVWQKFASNIVKGDSGKTYRDDKGNPKPYPMQDNFAKVGYQSFLTAAARYPYFCGEKGFYQSVDEACKREIASLFAHAAQETGNTKVTDSFYWIREAYVNGNSYFDTGCAAPFSCQHNFERYYGRGPKQLTYYYNYAGFSAAYFNGNYQYLLSWPDMVGYDPNLYFTSAIWFVMTHQPPKPSIHDVMLGKYKPDTTCTEPLCKGVKYNQTTGVDNNFDITIEVVNGGPECRGNNSGASENRTKGFKEVLAELKANISYAEANLPLGCDFIAKNGADPLKTIFADAKLMQNAHTWLDLTGSSCQAQKSGGAAMISVTAKGIVNACKTK